MAVLTRLVLVAVLVTSGSVEGIRLSMNPTTIVDGKTSTLTIRCDTDAVAGDTVYAIKILKSPSTTALAIVDSKPARVDPNIQQRATATGTVETGSNLVLTFNNAISCNDQGDYACEYNSERTSRAIRTNQTLQATNDPNNIVMAARPTMFTYNVNNTVELMCSGDVGKPVVGNWMWEMRDATFGSTWTSLRPGLTPVDETPVASGLCQMTGRSTLTFQVQMEDDNRMYRCYFRDSLQSGNFTFQVRGTSTVTPAVSVSTSTPATSTVTQDCQCQSQASSGLSTGASVAISVVLTFLLTLGATLAVGFLLLRHILMPGTPNTTDARQESGYSGLDLTTREPPRVNNVYDTVGHYAN